MEHTEDREKDLINLCNQVLNSSPISYYNNNGRDESICPFCLKSTYDNNCCLSIKEIEHKQDCAYYIAKDLLTNYDPKALSK